MIIPQSMTWMYVNNIDSSNNLYIEDDDHNIR